MLPITNTSKAYISKELNQKTKLKEFLDQHLQKKLQNLWLFDCIKNSSNFPYEAGDKCGKVESEVLKSKHQTKTTPGKPDSNLPLYLVNMPLAHLPEAKGYENLTNLIEIFKNEAFGTSQKESKKEIKERLALVIGINQIQSLDEEVNAEFKNWIHTIPIIKNLACKFFGFFWVPLWEHKQEVSCTYSAQEAYKTLKIISPKTAALVRHKIEGTEKGLSDGLKHQIPFQKIREAIKNSAATTSTAEDMAKYSKAPLYYAVMDADIVNLRNKRKSLGLFSRLDKTIISHNNPSAVTHGYSIKEPDRPLIELGVRLDMACREAMNNAICYSAYFPEPCSVFRIKLPDEPLTISMLHFTGAGNSLENRRLIASGLEEEVLERDAVFVADGGITTTTPSRMKTNSNKVDYLNPFVLKNEKSLKALRGISQTHIHPKHWADNLYIGLDFKCSRVTDATKPMMALFSLYDPLSRILNDEHRFSNIVIDNVFKDYNKPLSIESKNTRLKARKTLRGLEMPEDIIDSVEKAAIDSGQAIFKIMAMELNYRQKP